MVKIKLKDEELNNLKVFLQRVDLKGSEVTAFVDIINAINRGEEDGE